MTEAEDFPTPEKAALAGFPPGVASVIASASRGTAAYVLLETGTNAYPYPYGVHCELGPHGWHELHSSNGGSWSSSSDDNDRGTLVTWDNVPPDVEAVRIRYDGEDVEFPVENGYFLAVYWDAPDTQTEWPAVVAKRVRGSWTP